MLSKKLMKSALIAFSCMMLALPANTYAAGSNANQTISKTAAAKTDSEMSRTARALGGIYNAKTNTITLKSNKKLSKHERQEDHRRKYYNKQCFQSACHHKGARQNHKLPDFQVGKRQTDS